MVNVLPVERMDDSAQSFAMNDICVNGATTQSRFPDSSFIYSSDEG